MPGDTALLACTTRPLPDRTSALRAPLPYLATRGRAGEGALRMAAAPRPTHAAGPAHCSQPVMRPRRLIPDGRTLSAKKKKKGRES